MDTLAAAAAFAVSFATELEAAPSLVDATTGISADVSRVTGTCDENTLL